MNELRLYYKILGGHVHIRVFMNGGKAGDLCFRLAEFEALRADLQGNVKWIEEASE